MKSLDSFKHFSKLFIEQSGGHFQPLGMRIQSIEYGRMSLLMPYSDQLVGNPESGVIHGGCLTALLDTCCAFVAAMVEDELCFCPTIDLRIDYMGMAKPGESIIAQSELVRVTSSVIFVRGIAHQGDPENPVACCSASFLRVDGVMAEAMQEKIEDWMQRADLRSADR